MWSRMCTIVRVTNKLFANMPGKSTSGVSAKCSKGGFAIKRLQQITGTEIEKVYYHSNFEFQLRYGIMF